MWWMHDRYPYVDADDIIDNLFIYGMMLILTVFLLWSTAKSLFSSDASNTESTQSQQIEQVR